MSPKNTHATAGRCLGGTSACNNFRNFRNFRNRIAGGQYYTKSTFFLYMDTIAPPALISHIWLRKLRKLRKLCPTFGGIYIRLNPGDRSWSPWKHAGSPG
jgi:hypothetical protein